jgi:serine phosphatase RsbU (regulator of sigma subunit)
METTRGVLESVKRHAGDAKQSDDITVVAVRRLAQPGVAR